MQDTDLGMIDFWLGFQYWVYYVDQLEAEIYLHSRMNTGCLQDRIASKVGQESML